MFSVLDCGNVLDLIDDQEGTIAKFAKPGSSMQPMGGVFWYMPLEVSKAEAEEFFKRHLAQAPALNAQTIGERV